MRVCDDFHSRYNAIGRSYLYRLAIPRSEDDVDDPKTLWCPLESDRLYFVKRPFNVEAFLKTAEILSGVHDFSAITVESQRRDGITHPYRNVTIGIRRGDMILQKEYSLKPDYDVWEMHFKSKSYLYKQIRRMIGCMVAVGRGKFQVEDIKKFLQDPKHLEDHKIESAPSCGLYLKDVYYKASDLVYWPNRDVDYELFLDEAYQNYYNYSGSQSIKSQKENNAFSDNDTEENKNTELTECGRESDLLKEETDQSCFSYLNSLTNNNQSETSCIDESKISLKCENETSLDFENETSLKCESETSSSWESETSLKCEKEKKFKCENETNFKCECEIEESKNVKITHGGS
ncbi:tRNA pseudouridine synthase-like 1 isoform X2 [Patella vulgata]|nr:tRNA pseudouridine synthase-like 1 isoform X2 [Patella vulgata]XP_050411870.1 tRNA pseudouridine synthase-like 1 isoform X2 [Patella vulgata]